MIHACIDDTTCLCLFKDQPRIGLIGLLPVVYDFIADCDRLTISPPQLSCQHILIQFTAIGAFREVTLGYFDWERKEYVDRKYAEQVEVASLTGDVALGPDGAPAIHVHCVLGRRDYSALAGHLLKATIRPTLELVLVEAPVHLRKRHDRQSGLALIDLGA